MDATLLLILLTMFFAGVITATILPLPTRKTKPRTRSSRPSRHTRLDMTDEMVLWGEVTNDQFYGIM